MTDVFDDDPMFWARLQTIIERSVAGLDDQDRAERVAYCRRYDLHGVSALVVGDDLELHWGGRALAVVPRNAFDDDAYFEPITPTFLPEAPDDASELSGE